uniref:Uncharacterized protein n=1 Tax=Anguilla anguilla TaxID=7936 RepID=A0A0E9PBP9_ANGAN
MVFDWREDCYVNGNVETCSVCSKKMKLIIIMIIIIILTVLGCVFHCR